MDEHKLSAAALLAEAANQEDTAGRHALCTEALVHAVLHIGECLDGLAAYGRSENALDGVFGYQHGGHAAGRAAP